MNERVRVLVVDDSAFARVAISKTLNADPQIEIVGTAKDGVEALEQIKRLKPSVVTLDVTMPRMDGLEALGHIMAECATPVVMLSALTGDNMGATLEALELGAVDFFLKPSAISPAGQDGQAVDLIGKVKMAAQIPASKLRPGFRASSRPKLPKAEIRPSRVRSRVLIIGSSTGGPRALAEMMPNIPGDIRASILVVQHMPAGFTRSLAERLDHSCQIGVKEAEAGDMLETGKALMAPGGYHMVVDKMGQISLNQDPPVCGVRPSLDVTMESVAKVFGGIAVGVVLTGMGSDGTKGAQLIKKAGGKVTVEHESTCSVYGMPRSVVEAGCADSIVPLHRMASEIVRMCGE